MDIFHTIGPVLCNKSISMAMSEITAIAFLVIRPAHFYYITAPRLERISEFKLTLTSKHSLWDTTTTHVILKPIRVFDDSSTTVLSSDKHLDLSMNLPRRLLGTALLTETQRNLILVWAIHLNIAARSANWTFPTASITYLPFYSRAINKQEAHLT